MNILEIIQNTIVVLLIVLLGLWCIANAVTGKIDVFATIPITSMLSVLAYILIHDCRPKD